ncbi:hypothetical protein NQ176_g8038 [Zarea fungicola]|uniref:Uncharacterized protein n=1 Tax=Zarea fungicola TaxID=93591 RepID=A0ACC1MWX9_9HYPO|nr:hypothetical protein NQ176_g8038 [Lecanicillium fungicola]
MHRVRSAPTERFSVPFFSEPGVEAMVGERGKEVRYEEFVLEKMGTWVEFQDDMEEAEIMSAMRLKDLLPFTRLEDGITYVYVVWFGTKVESQAKDAEWSTILYEILELYSTNWCLTG